MKLAVEKPSFPDGSVLHVYPPLPLQHPLPVVPGYGDHPQPLQGRRCDPAGSVPPALPPGPVDLYPVPEPDPAAAPEVVHHPVRG